MIIIGNPKQMREEPSIEPSCLFLTLHDFFFLVGITICRWVLHNSASLTVVTCGLRKKKKSSTPGGPQWEKLILWAKSRAPPKACFPRPGEVGFVYPLGTQ